MSSFPLLEDRAWLLAQCESGQSISDIRRAAGCKSNGSVYQAFERHGIQYVPDRGKKKREEWSQKRLLKWPQLMDKEWLTDRYLTQGMGIKEIAALVQASIGPVLFALKFHGLEIRGRGRKTGVPQGERSSVASNLDDAAWMREQLLTKTLGQIAEEVKLSISTVCRKAKDHGLIVVQRRRTSGSIEQLNDREWLSREYTEKSRTQIDICTELKCNYQQLTNALRAHGIPVRTVQESKEIRGTKKRQSIYPLLNDEEWLRKKYLQEGLSLNEIVAVIPGLPHIGSVQKALAKFGIQCRHQTGKQPVIAADRSKLNDREWLEKRYVQDGCSMGHIGRELGVEPSSVHKALRRLDIQCRKSKSRKETVQKRRVELNDPDWLANEYLTNNRSVSSIAKQLKCTNGDVHSMIRKYNISRIPGREMQRIPSKAFFPLLQDKPFLEKRYLAENKTAVAIAAELGCSDQSVQASLCRFGLVKYPGRSYEKKDTDLPAGSRRDQKGYIRIYKPDHPFTNMRGYIFEHRLVCEEALGRYLNPEEEVHHLNIKTDDNRLENLLVMASYRDHMEFHRNPPAWVPRCPCCGKPEPEKLTGRPADVPLEWKP